MDARVLSCNETLDLQRNLRYWTLDQTTFVANMLSHIFWGLGSIVGTLDKGRRTPEKS